MPGSRRLTGLKVHQWLPEWEHVKFDPKSRRRRPESYFYIFSIRASSLKALSGISRRSTAQGLRRVQDTGIQRRHDSERSQKIREFVQYGYPWSELSLHRRATGEFDDLQKPGWLPTTIVVNILRSDDERHGKRVDPDDLVKIKSGANGFVELILPARFETDSWKPAGPHPIEVIDGQHRLWAFEQEVDSGEFELPVVAFYGLDLSWQAYLFWTINITPTRINASLAFDLYPLLRTEDWLEKFEGPKIYRETRAQELTENLWAYPKSPWYHRINMLGEPGQTEQFVTQAAWIRSLLATYVKSWEGRRISIGGLFGAPVGVHQTALPWSRTQQAAFLIFVWEDLRQQISKTNADWTRPLRHGAELSLPESGQDPAFAGMHTLLNTDQGVRGVLYVTNDLCFLEAADLELGDWGGTELDSEPSDRSIEMALKALRKTKAASYLAEVNKALAAFDWRTSAAPGLDDDEKIRKAALRGSGGYKELRKQLLKIVEAKRGVPGRAAKRALAILKYD